MLRSHWVRGFVASVGLVLGLSGCGAPMGVAGTGVDRVTESDQTPQRKRAQIRLELAVGYFEQGKTTIALDEVKQALQADPQYPDAFNLRGLIYMRLQDWELAQDSFRAALALKPGDGNVLHNLAWLRCQRGDYAGADADFSRALADPAYGARAKTWLTQGLCQLRAGNDQKAEASLRRSYELDAGNPITGYQLARLAAQRGDNVRAQFYLRRINNSEYANAESLWLGIKVERGLGQTEAVQQLAAQLIKRFADSREAQAYRRGAFDE
ncbi:MAG: type IV pilus biogenesis/stability protein PilW [Rhodoferax sp.]